MKRHKAAPTTDIVIDTDFYTELDPKVETKRILNLDTENETDLEVSLIMDEIYASPEQEN